ncbi:homeobox protein Crxos-like [Arvicanthis niloticus]|uniref:homeobox protein Crxos-like n=1 Tax=Arvicanthis niloticus TaxID=61156 RepID=UPI00402BEA74
MEPSPHFTSMVRSFEFTYKQFRVLKRHFRLDPRPQDKTLEVLADALKLRKRHLKAWFYMMQNKSVRNWFSKTYRKRRMFYRHCISTATTRQNDPEESSQNDPGLPEALEALKNLTLSGYQSTAGTAQD